MFGSYGFSLIQILYDVVGRLAALAGGMTEAARARTVLHIEYEIVAWAGSYAHGHSIQLQCATGFPSHHMICASGIAADAEAANQFAFWVVEG